jgi:hypothetical protein
LVRGPKAPRTDVRDVFKRRIEQSSALRRRAVAVLDFAEVFYRQLENANERCAPGDRLTLAQMETVALGAATSVPWSSLATPPNSHVCPAWKVRSE